MNPNKKVLFSFVSFFLVFVTIACSCSSLVPKINSTPTVSSGVIKTPKATQPVVSAATPTTVVSASASIEPVTGEIDLPAGTSNTISAACPSGSLMLGGGFASGNGIKITRTMPDPSGWLVAGLNTTTSTLPLTAYAYCLHNAPGTINIVSIDALVSGFPRAVCQNGEVLTGGGYAFDSDSLEVHISTPDGAPAPFAWSVGALNYQSADQSITVYAVCLANSNLTATLARDDQDTYVSGTDSVSVAITCPAGAVMSQGGYEGTGGFISRVDPTDVSRWEVQVQTKIYTDGSLDHAVCLNLP